MDNTKKIVESWTFGIPVAQMRKICNVDETWHLAYAKADSWHTGNNKYVAGVEVRFERAEENGSQAPAGA